MGHGRWRVGLADGTRLDARAIIVATPAAAALRLLAPVVPKIEPRDWPEATEIELATLVIDDGRLDAAPRGTGMLVAETVTEIRAKALTHASAKWGWVARAAEAAGHPSRHVLRLSYGRAGRGAPAAQSGAPAQSGEAGAAGPGRRSTTSALSDQELRELAIQDASALLGIALEPASVVGFSRIRWTNALPVGTLGQRARIKALREAAAERDGLGIVGAWLAGTGLASVIPDATRTGDEVRGELVREGLQIHSGPAEG